MKGGIDPIVLKASRFHLTMLYVFHLLFLASWTIATIVDEFSTGLFHVSFWLVIELVVLFVAWGTRGTHHILVIVITSVGIASLITHLVFCIVELVQCTSLLCAGPTQWILIVFTVIQACLIVLESFEIYYVWRHGQLLVQSGAKWSN